MSEDGLPRVCIINGSDRNSDLDSVDPNLKGMLGNVRCFTLQESFDTAIIAPVDAVLTLCHAKVDGELLDKLGGKVRTVSNYGVGVDHIDLEACATRSITVGNTPGVLTEATADMGWALLMACARRIPEGNDFAKSDAYTAYDNMILLGRAVAGATLGIVGMGRIGAAVAKRATGFGMKILYYNRSRNIAGEQETGAVRVELDALLAASDYVVLVCPSTPETHHLIDEAALARMKPTACLINIARGPVVNTDALTHALQTGQISSAGLDVVDPEPLPAGHALKKLDNCVMVPHRGSATVEARDGMAKLCISNLLKGLAGDALDASPLYSTK